MNGNGHDLEAGSQRVPASLPKQLGIKAVFAATLLLACSATYWLGTKSISKSEIPVIDAAALKGAELPPEVNIVQLPPGPVLGIKSPAFGQKYEGIPYGKADRFQPPRHPIPWYPNILDATKFRASCLRKGTAFMAEECLHLNVYTPLQLSEDLHPVVVWFHGGSFTMGAGSDTNKEAVKELVMTHRLIVVTINYRLGVFGYLGSEKLRQDQPGASTGNWGVLDQELSLEWVQTNIHRFGGDPKRVTLLGWSAGAASISVHLSMKSSTGKFSKAIMMSGGFTKWASITMDDAEQLYNDTVYRVGCQEDLDCLKAGPVCQCLLDMDADRLVNLQPGFGWGPTVDHVKLLHHPRDAVKMGYVHKNVPIIIGGAHEDSLVDIGAAATGANLQEFLDKEGAPQGITQHYINEDHTDKLYNGPIGSAHRGWSPAYWAVRSATADRDMNCPALEAARLWHNASGAPAYWYLWKAPSPDLIVPPSTNAQSKGLKESTCWPCPGASHGSDLPYLFEHSKLNVEDDFADLADSYQAFFKDFIKTGNPNNWNGLFFAAATGSKDMSEEGVAWTSVQGGKGGMLFSPGHSRFVTGLKDDVCRLWPGL